MKRNLREMIGNLIIINSPPHPIPKFIVYLLMTPMFSIFALAIKFNCVFSASFESFHLFVSFIFDKLPLPNLCFKRCFKSLFSPFQCIKQSQK